MTFSHCCAAPVAAPTRTRSHFASTYPCNNLCSYIHMTYIYTHLCRLYPNIPLCNFDFKDYRSRGVDAQRPSNTSLIVNIRIYDPVAPPRDPPRICWVPGIPLYLVFCGYLVALGISTHAMHILKSNSLPTTCSYI